MRETMVNGLKNGGLFLGLLVLTAYIILKDNSLGEIINAVSGADVRYLLLAVMFMGLFLCCEGLNIARSLKLFSYDIGLFSALKYAAIGFFFSAITPSASGGQPMQVYYMHKDGIEVAHSTLSLLFELLSFQGVTVTLAITCYLYQHDVIDDSLGNMKYLVILGIGLNFLVMVGLIIAIFTKKTIATIVSLVVKTVGMFSAPKAERLEIVLNAQLGEYQQSAKYFKENKSIFLKTVLTSCVQLLAMHCIPYLVYRCFGLTEFSLFEVVALQAVLHVSVSALPLPGALGVTESGFMILFKKLFPSGMLSSAMILSRGISFYLFVLITGIIVAAQHVKKDRIA